jgi:hypothetical protein
MPRLVQIAGTVMRFAKYQLVPQFWQGHVVESRSAEISVDGSGSTRSDCLRSAKEVGDQMELRVSRISSSTHGSVQSTRPFG